MLRLFFILVCLSGTIGLSQIDTCGDDSPIYSDKFVKHLIDSINNLNKCLKVEKSKICVIVTKYNAEKRQCDNDPFTTASGSKIPPKKIKRLRWVALSRDLLKEYNNHAPFKFNDTIIIEGTKSKANGKWIVHDVMASRYCRYVDLLVDSSDVRYKKVGLNSGTIRKK